MRAASSSSCLDCSAFLYLKSVTLDTVQSSWEDSANLDQIVLPPSLLSLSLIDVRVANLEDALKILATLQSLEVTVY